MRMLIRASLVASAIALGAVPVAAMPLDTSNATSAEPAVTLVSGGCGIYFHRGPYGGCIRNGFYRARPYGWHRGGWHRWGWHRGWHRW